jgi:hypothetical protein
VELVPFPVVFLKMTFRFGKEDVGSDDVRFGKEDVSSDDVRF